MHARKGFAWGHNGVKIETSTCSLMYNIDGRQNKKSNWKTTSTIKKWKTKEQNMKKPAEELFVVVNVFFPSVSHFYDSKMNFISKLS